MKLFIFFWGMFGGMLLTTVALLAWLGLIPLPELLKKEIHPIRYLQRGLATAIRSFISF